MALIRPWSQTLNAARFVWQNPCGEKWTVIAELTNEPVGAAALVLLTPSPKEIIEEYTHPSSFRKSPKTSRRKSARTKKSTKPARDKKGRYAKRASSRWRARGKRAFQKATALERAFTPPIPDADEVIAERLPGKVMIGERIGGLVPRFIWYGIDVLDRVAFWFMLADIAIEGPYGWMSGVIEGEKCKDNFAVFAELVQPQPEGSHVLEKDAAFLVSSVNTEWKQAPDFAGGEIAVKDFMHIPAFVVWTGKIYTTNDGGNNVQLQVLRKPASPLVQTSIDIGPGEDKSFTLAMFDTNPSGRWLFGGGTNVGNGNWSFLNSKVEVFGAPNFGPPDG